MLFAANLLRSPPPPRVQGKAKTLSAIDQLMFQSIRDDPVRYTLRLLNTGLSFLTSSRRSTVWASLFICVRSTI